MFDPMPAAGDSRAGRTALEAIAAGIDAARPETVVDELISVSGTDPAGGSLRIGTDRYDLAAYDEVIVLGGGNAAGRLARALADRLGNRLDGGVVVTDDPVSAGPVEVVEGTHPVPSDANAAGTRQLLQRARGSDEGTLVLAPITGGGSALLTAPADGITTDELASLTDALLASGAPIERINAVRKHASAIKGGRLAREIAPATVVGLLLSDVTGDDPAVVASGPLAGDPTTYDDALAVLSEYDVEVPDSVRRQLRAGIEGDRPETPTAADPAVEAVSTHVLATNRTACAAAVEACEAAGFETLLLSASVRGEAREAAKTHVAIAEEIRRSGSPLDPPAAFVSGGETTVTIAGDGTGGPNQEFALSAAIELADRATLAAVDTDGIDGPTDAAGAIVTETTVPDDDPTRTDDGTVSDDGAASDDGTDGILREARARLADNDALPFLEKRDALLVSGPTGTNVNDLRVVIVPE
ncbi:glycerate kinase type-2 family protein [Halopenitus persicus]|uniref:glycerate kinase type-2 family protein n=1 Tax=Halopenitus persicus TaxID=1048396 RepID=UPI000BBA7384|nr:DUF4147 domain-containing protein [Halopenitus persicus]